MAGQQYRLDLNQSAIDDLMFDAEWEDLAQDVGDQVAEVTQQLAPKLTGAGAASIHAEVSEDSDGIHALVSWHPDQFYMLFVEVGTAKMPPRPFLRPALDQTQI